MINIEIAHTSLVSFTVLTSYFMHLLSVIRKDIHSSEGCNEKIWELIRLRTCLLSEQRRNYRRLPIIRFSDFAFRIIHLDFVRAFHSGLSASPPSAINCIEDDEILATRSDFNRRISRKNYKFFQKVEAPLCLMCMPYLVLCVHGIDAMIFSQFSKKSHFFIARHFRHSSDFRAQLRRTIGSLYPIRRFLCLFSYWKIS